MKTIFLTRHAKAVSKDLGLPDFERSLTSKGEKESEQMVARLVRQQVIPELLVSSPANRALETAHIFAGGYSYPVQQIQLDETLYYCTDVSDFFKIVQNLEDEYGSVMLFGHNPSFDEFASLMVPDFTENIPKAAVVSVSYEVEHWRDVAEGGGKLEFFQMPLKKKEMVKKKEQILEVLTNKLTEMLNQSINAIDPDVTEYLQDSIEKYGSKLAKEMIATGVSSFVAELERSVQDRKITDPESSDEN